MKVILLLTAFILQVNAYSFTINIKNIDLKQGHIGVILYNLRMEELFGVFLQTNEKNLSYSFLNLKANEYILVAFYDSNSNGQLDKNEKYFRENKILKRKNKKTTIDMRRAIRVYFN